MIVIYKKIKIELYKVNNLYLNQNVNLISK